MSDLRRALVVPDQHFPLHDEKAVNCVLQAIDIVKPNIFINLGDVGEWDSVSAWRWKGKKLPPLEYQLPLIEQEITEVNAGLDLFDEKLKGVEKHMLVGNHDDWLDKFVEKNPYLYNFTFRRACKLDERKYHYHNYNKPLKIGKLNFIHGVFTTVYHAKLHAERFGANLVYGHTHDIQRHTLTKLGGTVSAWSLGCLKDMTLESNIWLKGRPHNWNHGFGIVTWYPNGNFQVEVVDIQNGNCFVWGELVEG
jgi:predicted phosphodiesterase